MRYKIKPKIFTAQHSKGSVDVDELGRCRQALKVGSGDGGGRRKQAVAAGGSVPLKLITALISFINILSCP